jgi:hypothetical protein
LPTVELAIATDDQGDAIESAPVSASLAIDPWEQECDWEYSQLSPVVFPITAQSRTAIALLPPAKEPHIPQKPQQREKAKTPRKTSQKLSHKGKQLSLR